VRDVGAVWKLRVVACGQVSGCSDVCVEAVCADPLQAVVSRDRRVGLMEMRIDMG